MNENIINVLRENKEHTEIEKEIMQQQLTQYERFDRVDMQNPLCFGIDDNTLAGEGFINELNNEAHGSDNIKVFSEMTQESTRKTVSQQNQELTVDYHKVVQSYIDTKKLQGWVKRLEEIHEKKFEKIEKLLTKKPPKRLSRRGSMTKTSSKKPLPKKPTPSDTSSEILSLISQMRLKSCQITKKISSCISNLLLSQTTSLPDLLKLTNIEDICLSEAGSPEKKPIVKVMKKTHVSPKPTDKQKRNFRKRKRSLGRTVSRSPSPAEQLQSCMRLSQELDCTRPNCSGNHHFTKSCSNNYSNLKTAVNLNKSPRIPSKKKSIQTGIQMEEMEGFDPEEIKVFKTYEKMLKGAAKLVCKNCSVKLRPEKFYEHVLYQQCENTKNPKHIKKSKHTRQRSDIVCDKFQKSTVEGKIISSGCDPLSFSEKKETCLTAQKDMSQGPLAQIDQNSCTDPGSSKDELLQYLSHNLFE